MYPSGNNIEEQLKNTLLTSREKCLLNILFGEELTEDTMCTLLRNFDIDQANQNYILMLSCLGYMKNWEYFPPEIIPRLKGVHRYHQVHNSIGIPWLVKQLRILSDAGIPIMLIKGIAMKAYYAKGTPRLMWDYDIAVPEENFVEARRLLCTGSNILRGEFDHSCAIRNGKEELDLHHWIFKDDRERDSSVWEKAIHFDFYGIDVCVPSPEDMFIHQMNTQIHNWIRNEGSERRMKWLYDCRCIWDFLGDKNLYNLSVRVKELYITNKTQMMLRLFMWCFPDLLDEAEVNKIFPVTEKYYQWLKAWMWYKEECEKSKEYSLRSKDSNRRTPEYAIRWIKVRIAHYRYIKPEIQEKDPDMNFWRYFKKRKIKKL